MEYKVDYTVFDAKDLDEAKHIAVSPNSKMSVNKRWNVETQHVLKNVAHLVKDNYRILDFGCGAGRMSKALLEYNKTLDVTGVDISQSMLDLATENVGEGFKAVHVDDWKEDDYDIVFTLLCLQHIDEQIIFKTLDKIKKCCNKYLIVINSIDRYVPTTEKGCWIHDRINLENEINMRFECVGDIFEDKEHPITNFLEKGSVKHICKIYKRRK